MQSIGKATSLSSTFDGLRGLRGMPRSRVTSTYEHNALIHSQFSYFSLDIDRRIIVLHVLSESSMIEQLHAQHTDAEIELGKLSYYHFDPLLSICSRASLSQLINKKKSLIVVHTAVFSRCSKFECHSFDGHVYCFSPTYLAINGRKTQKWNVL